jgi:hypothetical protein
LRARAGRDPTQLRWGATLELRPLDQQRDRLSTAEAQRRDAALGLAFRHRVEQRDEDARACKVLVWDGTGLCIFQKLLGLAAACRVDEEGVTDRSDAFDAGGERGYRGLLGRLGVRVHPLSSPHDMAMHVAAINPATMQGGVLVVKEESCANVRRWTAKTP